MPRTDTRIRTQAKPAPNEGTDRAAQKRPETRRFIIAWLLCLVFYFLEYASRSTPGVMVPQLSRSFGITAFSVSTLLGAYYYTYSLTSLVAGASLDRMGARYAVPCGLLLLGAGCVLFLAPNESLGYIARLLQGAGSAFAFTGAVYLATHGLPARWLSTAIGFTQCVGMTGGFAGQFAVGPAMQRGIPWQAAWWVLGIGSVAIAVVQAIVTPSQNASDRSDASSSVFSPYAVVFRNPQSYLCGAISGLLFAPTTIGAMTWGVALFQKDLGYTYGPAVLAASMVPLGWVFGCPLLGWISDRIGRRKPVLMAGGLIMIALMLQTAYAPRVMPLATSCLLFGMASGAAMIPYSVIKEVNPDKVKGSATGGINFITFGVSAVLGPMFGPVARASAGSAAVDIAHFRSTLLFWTGGVAIAMLLALALRETGRAARAR